MILSQTINCASRFGYAESVEMIAKAGFDAVDFSLSAILKNNDLVESGEYKKIIYSAIESAKRNCIYFNQGHALGSIQADTPENTFDLLVQRNIIAIEIGALLGVKTLVVHPICIGPYIGNEERIFEDNMKYYHKLLPYAKDNGIKIACENMWCGDRKRGVVRGSVCSNPYEHAYYVDAISDENFVACLDVGHSSLAGREAQDCIKVLGSRLQALHIHDNDYKDDMHTLPGLSEMNWTEITKALAQVDYSGDFTFETNHFFDSLETREETECGLKLSELIGRKLISQIESFKHN